MKEELIILDKENEIRYAQHCAHKQEVFSYRGALYLIKSYKSRDMQSCGFINERTINEVEFTVVKIQ